MDKMDNTLRNTLPLHLKSLTNRAQTACTTVLCTLGTRRWDLIHFHSYYCALELAGLLLIHRLPCWFSLSTKTNAFLTKKL